MGGKGTKNEGVETVRAALNTRTVVSFPSPDASAKDGDGEGASGHSSLPGGQAGDPGPTPTGIPGDGGGYNPYASRLPLREDGLPEGCPITPLGKDKSVFFFLDSLSQVQGLPADKLSQSGVEALFAGHTSFLYEWLPRVNQHLEVTGYRGEKVRAALIDACARKGIFSDAAKVRGRGAWVDESGGLILHLGDQLYREHEYIRLGEIDGKIYPGEEKLARPDGRPQSGPEQPADQVPVGDELLALLEQWRFARPAVDPRLMLGWIAAALLGGALDWRPMLFLIGDKATGKSTLHKLVAGVMSGGLLSSADTTAAGIYQAVKQSALPVAIDELEAEADNQAQMKVIKLARLAASGGVMLRGGSHHSGTEFLARSCFLFSAVNAPPLKPTDLSRMALLNLRRLPRESKPPDLAPARLAELGARVLKRLVELWPLLGETLQDFRGTLQKAEHDGRGADQFGTLLACGHLLLWESRPDAEELALWADRLKADTVAELSSADANWRRCLSHLLMNAPDSYRGGSRMAVGAMIEAIIADPNAVTEYRDPLARVGLRVMRPGLPKGRPATPVEEYMAGRDWLFISHRDPGLTELFEGTPYAGVPGEPGVWYSALQQMPRGTRAEPIWTPSQARVAGTRRRGVMIQLQIVHEMDKVAADAADEDQTGQGAWSDEED